MILKVSPMVPGVALVTPREAAGGQYVPLATYEALLRAHEELKGQYDNLLYASQRLAESRRTQPCAGEVQEVRVGLHEGEEAQV